MKTMFTIPMVVLLLWTSSYAQITDTQPRGVEDKLTVKLLLSKDGVLPGTECRAMLIVSIDEGWHINSYIPNVEGFIATSVEMERTEGVELVSMKYPPAFEQALDFSETPLEVYEGTIKIMLHFKVALDASPGKHTIPLELRYQACSNEVCLAPTAVQFDLPLTVVDKLEDVSLINQELFDENER
ncbi:MAG: protein-disulfide reductase DsbD domain-containing protein [Bacteroidota bacterium]